MALGNTEPVYYRPKTQSRYFFLFHRHINSQLGINLEDIPQEYRDIAGEYAPMFWVTSKNNVPDEDLQGQYDYWYATCTSTFKHNGDDEFYKNLPYFSIGRYLMVEYDVSPIFNIEELNEDELDTDPVLIDQSENEIDELFEKMIALGCEWGDWSNLNNTWLDYGIDIINEDVDVSEYPPDEEFMSDYTSDELDYIGDFYVDKSGGTDGNEIK